ncbi:MAG: formate dehydrogenase accessory sulfurtransferase FdhD [Caulobacter sp.]|nr:formate dehydrogenase accessory sulfurtransferase FdhD [Caulobacter sp.]
MSGDPRKLIRMANQIAAELSSQRPGEAVEATREHLRQFWDPKMRADIAAFLAAGGEGLSPTAHAAIADLFPAPAPAVQEGSGGRSSDEAAALVAVPFRVVRPDGSAEGLRRQIAVEQPVAVEFNGLGYAVMMMSPVDLVDFAYGFALSERLIDRPEDILEVGAHTSPLGTILRITLTQERRERIVDRVRHRVTESSCGLCGIENLEQALRPLPVASTPARPTGPAVFRALAAMRSFQPLNAETGAVHAALACDADGAVLLAREDVGRHTAFDKLIGAMLREGRPWTGGFALLSSRCSYDLVEKAALAGCPALVTVSAPTSLALTRAAEAGVALLSLARSDAVLFAEVEGAPDADDSD